MSVARLLPPPSSSPDLICQLLIAVGLAGSQLPALDRSDLNRRESERCGPRRTSNGAILRAAGLAGPQPDLNGQKQSHIECKRECQNRISEDMPDRMSEDIPDRMPDRMSEDMPRRYAR